MTDQQEGPGAELRATRESMDVSAREIADALNLPTHVIEALESDDYEKLPPSVFSRGYLRSYARLLELEPERLLARYPEVTEEVDVVTREVPAASLPGGRSLQSLAMAAIGAVALIFFLVWWFSADDEADSPAESNAEEQIETPIAEQNEASADTQETSLVEESSRAVVSVDSPADAPETNALTADPSMPEDSIPEDSMPDTSPRAAPVEEPSPESARAVTAAAAGPSEVEPVEESLKVEASRGVGLSAAEDAAPPAPSRRERRITEFGDDEITIVFTDDCWVEVKSTDGENLYSDLNRAGRTLVLIGRAPFRVLLGYAPGASLSFNGEPVPLERYSRNNVANLVLGEQ